MFTYLELCVTMVAVVCALAPVLEPGECCVVQQARHHALMVLLNQSPSYYRTLSHKLHWAGSLHAAQHSQN